MTLLVSVAFTGLVRADDPSKEGMAAFKQYLEKNHKEKKWQTGPSRLDSKELQQAYPGQQFFYVYSAPPLPPGAPLPELIERHRKASAEFRKNYISLAAAVGKDGVRPLSNKVQDLGRGLAPVKDDAGAKSAAAAVLSLYIEGGYSLPPALLKADAVKAEKSDKGWTCQVQQMSLGGTVTFDADGKLTSVSKSSHIPLPPSAPPRPR
jgi:hypothetical protein